MSARLVAEIHPEGVSTALRVPLFLNAAGATAAVQPVTVGIPMPRGRLGENVQCHLHDEQGRPVLLQTQPLAAWPDGSVRWMLLDFVVPANVSAGAIWTFSAGGSNGQPVPGTPVHVHESASKLVVDTGVGQFTFHPEAVPFQAVHSGGQEMLVSPARFRFVDAKGRERQPCVEKMEAELRGPVRAVVRLDGHLQGRPECRFVVRCECFAGLAQTRLHITLHNPRRARHRDGLWDLGDPNSLLFRAWTLELPVGESDAPTIEYQVQPDERPRTLAGKAFELYQDSSGGEHWNSPNHVNREGRVPCRFRGYQLRAGKQTIEGLRANPVIAYRSAERSLALAIPEFWQQFPKAIEIDSRQIRVGLFPRQFGDLHELQGGEQKTHSLVLDFTAGRVGSLSWVHQPLRVRPPVEWYTETRALPFFAVDSLPPADEPAGTPCEALLNEAIGGPNNLLARREITDEYGWRHFGDTYADHETRYYEGPPPLISHYNNQYDLIWGALLQHLRTGEDRWWQLLDPLARHVIDIDIYRTNEDKAAYNHGLFWHTDHYLNAATCTHRAFTKANRPPNGVYGGGPSCEHNYTTGLLHYYYLTGNAQARDAVIGLANWVIREDDGCATILGLVDDGPTGLASATEHPEYHGPGRGSGNSVNALLDAWLLTGDRSYLDKAESLIRRSVHPADDIAANDLLNIERRWSYTVFLVVLSRYLTLKTEAGQIDFMYAYAQASLVAYARWMAANERFYYDRREQLQYPTETWCVQELRKANVLRLAAAHVDEAERSLFLARAEAFETRDWHDLMQFPSRLVTRSVALLLAEGFRNAYLRRHPLPPAARPRHAYGFGKPERFVPQKSRVKRLLRSPSGLATVMFGIANPSRWARLGKLR